MAVSTLYAAAPVPSRPDRFEPDTRSRPRARCPSLAGTSPDRVRPGRCSQRGRVVGVLWVSQHAARDPALPDCTLFVHLASLVAGMGAVLTLDWLGVRWLPGRGTLWDTLRAAGSCHTLIWLGLAGLMVSGAFPSP